MIYATLYNSSYLPLLETVFPTPDHIYTILPTTRYLLFSKTDVLTPDHIYYTTHYFEPTLFRNRRKLLHTYAPSIPMTISNKYSYSTYLP